ncbi:MAG: GNVR domain-containing protein [Acidobacteriota bacterium]|nr:GNVR domain-containing protein [Acidobacteriota bacterium]
MKRTPSSIQDYLEIVQRRGWWLAVPTAAIALGVFFGSLWLPRQYRSEATIMIEPPKVSASYVQPTIATDITDRLQSIRQEILSRSRIRKLISDFGLYGTTPGQLASDAVVEQMRRNIDVEIVNNPMAADRTKTVAAFRISYAGSDPALVQKVTRNIASLFIEEHLKVREQESEGTTSFLDDQLEKMRQSLQEQEKQIEGFKAKHAGELPEQEAANFQLLGQMQSTVQTNSDAITRAQQQRSYLAAVLENMQSNTAPDPVRSPLQQQLDVKNAELLHAEQKYKANHPDIRKLKDEIAAIKAQLDAQKADGGDGRAKSGAAQTQVEIAGLDKEITSRSARQKQIERTIQEMESRMGQLPQVEQQLAGLTRDYETSKTSYETLLSKRNNSSVAAEMERRAEGEQFRILDPASYPDRPAKPNLMQIDIVGLLAGLFVGCALALLAELSDTSLNSPKDLLQCAGVPVLGCMPHMKNDAERKRDAIRRWTISAAMTATAAGAVLLAYWQKASIMSGFGWKF